MSFDGLSVTSYGLSWSVLLSVADVAFLPGYVRFVGTDLSGYYGAYKSILDSSNVSVVVLGGL